MVSVNDGVDQTGGIDLQRIHDLDEVTRGYAKYGRTDFALGLSAIYAWFTGAWLVHLLSAGWGRLLLVMQAPLWFVMVLVARRWYQRRGAVVPTEDLQDGERPKRSPFEEAQEEPGPARTPRVRGLRELLWFGGAPAVAFLVAGPSWFKAPPLPGGLAFGFVVACLLATAILAWLIGRGYWDTTPAGTPLFFAFISGITAFEQTDIIIRVLFPALGLLGVAKGVYQHLQFRRLERRLLALQADKVDDAPSLLPERR